MYPRLAHLGSIVVPTSSVCAALGLVCAMLLAEWCAPRAGVPKARVWNLSLAILFGTVVLSRLALIAQSPGALLRYPFLLLALPTLTRFGGAFALLCGAAWIGLSRMPWLRTLDAMAPAALLLLAFLHAGAFFAGTDLGSGTSLHIGNLVPGDEGHHPVALYAAVACVAACAGALAVLLRQPRAGMACGAALAGGAVARFFADEFRPAYLLPPWRVPGFLRVDQLVLIGLTVAGMLLLLRDDRGLRHDPENSARQASEEQHA